jgi:acylphosphatase
MIARKIVYQGRLDAQAAETIYDIARKAEITGEVKFVAPDRVELALEGDPAQIKLVQHQVERRVKTQIENKEVLSVPFRYYHGLDFLR